MSSDEIIEKVITLMSNERVKKSIKKMNPYNKQPIIKAIKNVIKSLNDFTDEERLVIVEHLNNQHSNGNPALYTSGEVEDIIILFVRIINNPVLFNKLKHVTTYKPKYDKYYNIIKLWKISKRINKDNQITLENENEIKKIILCCFIEEFCLSTSTNNDIILPDDDSYRNLKTSISKYIDDNSSNPNQDHPIIKNILRVKPEIINNNEVKKNTYILLYILHNIPVDELLKILNKLNNK